MQVQFSDVVFAFDFSRIETVGGVRYLWDYGPNGFHFAFPGGAADPAIGLDGSLVFAGAQYLSLPAARLAAFYARLPTQEHTWLVSFLPTNDQHMYLWSCDDNGAGGTWDGIALYREAANDRLAMVQLQGGAGFPYVGAPANTGLVGRRRVFCGTVEAAPRILLDDSSATGAWVGGAFGAASFNTAIVPRLGTNPSAGNSTRGNIYYLALLRGSLASEDLSLYSRLISEGVKPWCVR